MEQTRAVPHARACTSRRRSLGRWWVGGAALALAIVPRTASAQASPTVTSAPQEPGGLYLGGHHFIAPATFPTSFVVSRIAIRLDTQFYGATDVPTEAGSRTASTLEVIHTLEGSVKITDWAGIYARARLGILVGSDLPGLVYTGGLYTGTLEGNAVFRLFRSDTTGTQVSLLVGGGYTKGMSLSVFPLLDQGVAPTARAVLQGDLGSSLRTPFDSWNIQGNAAAAQAIGHCFSLQGVLGGGVSVAHVEPWDSTAAQRGSASHASGVYNAAAGFEADANAVGVPVAALVEYALTLTPDLLQAIPVTTSDFVSTLSLGVYYSGRHDLQLGLIGGLLFGLPHVLTNVGRSAAPNSEYGALELMYVW